MYLSFFHNVKALREIHAILTQKLREYATLYATVKNSVAHFKRGDISSCVGPRPVGHKIMTTPGFIVQILEENMQDLRVSAKSIAEQLTI